MWCVMVVGRPPRGVPLLPVGKYCGWLWVCGWLSWVVDCSGGCASFTALRMACVHAESMWDLSDFQYHAAQSLLTARCG